MRMEIKVMKEILLMTNRKEKEYFIMKMGLKVMKEIL